MSKIGTAHIEIKPVINEEALAEITKRVAEAVRAGVEDGMSMGHVITDWDGNVVKVVDG